jgi:hypothetical protein
MEVESLVGLWTSFSRGGIWSCHQVKKHGFGPLPHGHTRWSRLGNDVHTHFFFFSDISPAVDEGARDVLCAPRALQFGLSFPGLQRELDILRLCACRGSRHRGLLVVQGNTLRGSLQVSINNRASKITQNRKETGPDCLEPMFTPPFGRR